MSLTPMITGIAFAVAAIAFLAWAVMPSRGSDNIGGERPNSDGIIAPDDIAFEEDIATETPVPGGDGEDRVVRIDEPLVLPETSAPAQLDDATATPTENGRAVLRISSTPRVINTSTPAAVATAPPPQPSVQVPTRVPPTVAPTATPERDREPTRAVPTATATEQGPDLSTPIPTSTRVPPTPGPSATVPPPPTSTATEVV
ncbi:MAG: hypothetical protein M3Y37_00955, partial [Chloroflexota bacterium]|nr:hypothetical protein [Chloroflexota bacterium]